MKIPQELAKPNERLTVVRTDNWTFVFGNKGTKLRCAVGSDSWEVPPSPYPMYSADPKVQLSVGARRVLAGESLTAVAAELSTNRRRIQKELAAVATVQKIGGRNVYKLK